jgi:hypothetical protein
VFDWDIPKAIANFEKHGVPFEEAATIFGDSDALDWEDVAHSHQEPRFKRLGLGGQACVVGGVHDTERA